jgi:hypothetical protein
VSLGSSANEATARPSIGRARTIIRGSGAKETRAHKMFRRTNQLLAWLFGCLQIVSILVGIVLVLGETPPAFLDRYLLSLF